MNTAAGVATPVFAALALLLTAATAPRQAARRPTRRTGPLAHDPPAAASRRRVRAAAWAVGVAVAAALVATAGPVPVGAVGCLALAERRAAGRRARRRLRRQIDATLPDALDLFVVSLGAGLRPVECFELLAPLVSPALARPWAEVVDRVHRGERFADAVTGLGQLGPDALAFATTLSMTDAAGLPLAPVVDRLADDARQQRRRAAEAAARELPVRLAFPLVLCTLPAFVLVAIVPLLLGALSSLRAT